MNSDEMLCALAFVSSFPVPVCLSVHCSDIRMYVLEQHGHKYPDIRMRYFNVNVGENEWQDILYGHNPV